MTTTIPTQTYEVSWVVIGEAQAWTTFEAPAGLSEEELKNFMREEGSVDFEIKMDAFEYDNVFEDLDCRFDFECAD